MQIHASCAARGNDGVLITGPPGCGKSDLTLRLLDRGFTLVADDQVIVTDFIAQAPAALRGLLEVRGLGILRLPSTDGARLRLVVRASPDAERLPHPRTDADFGLPLIELDAFAPSAAQRVALALDCALGTQPQHTGAFAP
jgi:HPr kinase/phosphorylase